MTTTHDHPPTSTTTSYCAPGPTTSWPNSAGRCTPPTATVTKCPLTFELHHGKAWGERNGREGLLRHQGGAPTTASVVARGSSPFGCKTVAVKGSGTLVMD